MDFLIDDKEKTLYEKLDHIISQYKAQPGRLIRILQNGQNIFGYLPPMVQAYISDKLSIPISTVNGVVSFYSLFSEKPVGKYVVSVCLGTACYVKGSKDVLGAIKDELQIGANETSMDGLFTIRTTRCIGACGLAPVVTVNEDVYGLVSPDDIPGIMHKYLKEHKKSAVRQ